MRVYNLMNMYRKKKILQFFPYWHNNDIENDDDVHKKIIIYPLHK